MTGSPSSANDGFDWIERLSDLIVDADSKNKRIVASCFGHQLIADALGGRVEKSDKGWGIGRHTYAVHARREWMDPPLPELSLLACHQDQIVEPPPGAEVLASSPFCEYAMLAAARTRLARAT